MVVLCILDVYKSIGKYQTNPILNCTTIEVFRSKIRYNKYDKIDTYCTADGKDGLCNECNVFEVPQIGSLEKIDVTQTVQCARSLESVCTK